MTRKYRHSWWFVALILVILLPQQIALLLVEVFAIGVIAAISFRLGWIFILADILCMVPLLLLHLFACVIAVGNTLASYVCVSQEGLEIRSWPFYRLQLDWVNVQWTGGASGWGRHYGMIRLAGAQEIPEGTITTAFSKAFMRFRGGIGLSFTLNTIQGYHRGEFADQLRHYAPHLFSDGDMSSPVT